MMKYQCFVIIVACLGPVLAHNAHFDGDIMPNFLHAISNHPSLSILKNYHVVVPYQMRNAGKRQRRGIRTELQQESGHHLSEAHFSFDFEGRNYILDLSINQWLLPDSFTTSSYSHEGKLLMHKPTTKEKNHCYYQGNVRNIEESQVIMSTCNGLRGYIIFPNDLLIMEPLADVSGKSFNNKHIVYRLDDMQKKAETQNFICGNTESNDGVEAYFESLHFYSKAHNMSHFRHKRNIATEKKFVELMIVADNLEAKRFPDRIKLDARIKELVNVLDGFYQKLGIRVVLSHIEVWNHSNRVELPSDAQKALDAFLLYRQTQIASVSSSSPWAYTDNVQLLYGGDFDSSTVGMASVGSMCGKRSGGVNQDHGRENVLTTAATMAHEMGHNFGMQHDTSTCDCPANAECIMAAASGFSSNREWSSCSRSYLEQNVLFGSQSCLVNVPEPSRIYGGPQCGNDIIEKGEECDCGPADTCQSRCCNATTCLLLPGASCDAGVCCSDCQFSKAGTLCRATDGNTCDLSEHCTGNSANCPGNTYVQDGTPCLDETAACFDGICLTHDMQCEAAWGKGSSSSADRCYQLVNKKGDDNGNCGKNNQGYIKCTASNAKCGKLQCQGGGNRPVIGKDRYAYRNTITVGTQKFECKTIGSLNSTDVTDPGLVLDGTMCESGKVCLEGSCTKVQSLTCSSKCNGHGVCNQLDHCHCDSGWGPPYCAAEGYGGSVDSGPMNVDNTPAFIGTSTSSLGSVSMPCIHPQLNTTVNASAPSLSSDIQMILLIVMLLVVLPILLGVGTFIWYRYCGGRSYIENMRKNRDERLKAVARNKQVKNNQQNNGVYSSHELLCNEPTTTISYQPPSENDWNRAGHYNQPDSTSRSKPAVPPIRPPLPPTLPQPIAVPTSMHAPSSQAKPMSHPPPPPATKKSGYEISLQPPVLKPPPPKKSLVSKPIAASPARMAPPPPKKNLTIPPNFNQHHTINPPVATRPQPPTRPPPAPSFQNQSSEPENLSVMERARRFNAA